MNRLPNRFASFSSATTFASILTVVACVAMISSARNLEAQTCPTRPPGYMNTLVICEMTQRSGNNATCVIGETLDFYANPGADGYAPQSCDSLTWDFGDGTTANGATVHHQYANAGTFRIVLTDSNALGTTDTCCGFRINISSEMPCPIGAPSPKSYVAASCAAKCEAGQSIAFSVTAPAAPQECDTFAWEFSDGFLSTDRAPVHTFARAGAYSVYVTDRNADGFAFVGLAMNVVDGPAPPKRRSARH